MKKIASFCNGKIALAAVVLSQTISVSQAQPQPRGENLERPRQPAGEGRLSERRPQGGPQGFQPGGQQGFNGVNAMERVLTEDQRESIRKLLESNRETTRENLEKIREARKELSKLALDAEFNESAVRAKALEIAKLEADMTVMRLKALSEVQPALSAEQIEKIMNPIQTLRQNMGRPEGEGGRFEERRNRPQLPPEGEMDAPQPRKRERQ